MLTLNSSKSMSRKTVLLTAVLIASVSLSLPAMAAKAKSKTKPAAKTVAKKTPTKAAAAPAAPKVVKVVDMYAADPISLKQTGSTLRVTLCPEEYEPAPILVKSPKAIPAAKITVASDLVSGGSKLAKNNISAWVIEDGLLRKDDTDRFSGDPAADLSAGTKAFWLDVYAPKGTKPGTYKGTVLVSKDKAIGSIPIEVTVLPIRLLRSSKQYGMLVPYTSASMSADTWKAYLSETYNAGFSVAALAEPAATAGDVFAAYKASRLGVHGIYAGFLNGGTAFTEDDVKSINSLRVSSGASELFVLGADRPADQTAFAAAHERLQTILTAGVRTAARIDSQEAYDYLKDDLRAVIYSSEHPYIQSLLSGQTRSNGKREWWYWDASEDAMKDRIYGGVKLWKSGLDGAYIEPGPVDYNLLALTGTSRLLQPVEGGVLPTTNWEALREGVDDTRYITTLMTVVREAKDQKAGKTLYEAAESYLNTFMSKPFDTLTYTDLQKFRAQTAQYIVKLREIVK